MFKEQLLPTQKCNLQDFITTTKRYVNFTEETPAVAAHKVRVLRGISILSACLSIVPTAIACYIGLACNQQKIKFKYKLVLFLLMANISKAVFILIISGLQIVQPPNQNFAPQTENILGFFTALTIEMNDFAILTFAFYSLITVYYPDNGEKWLNSKRYYIYAAVLLMAVLLASLGFLVPGGYATLQVYVYLPLHPLRFRLGLSWIPRATIALIILVIYPYIYFYVSSQLKRLEYDIDTLCHHVSATSASTAVTGRRWSSIYRLVSSWMSRNELNPDDQTLINGYPAELDLGAQLQLDNHLKLKNRYRYLRKQLKEIFIYPAAFIIIWCVQASAYGVDVQGKSNYPFGIVSSLFATLNGFVDSLVFLYIEKPWRLTYARYDHYHPRDKQNWAQTKIPKSRIFFRFLPLYHIPEGYFETRQTMEEQQELQQFTIHPSEYGVIEPSTHAPNSVDHLDGSINELGCSMATDARSEIGTVKSSSSVNEGNQPVPLNPLPRTPSRTHRRSRTSRRDATDTVTADGMNLFEMLTQGP
ncbi:hypothetical protein WICPIJ_003196 [Wickerhamomyces pijperi]|uniref:G-protein coupled receptors family 1 profile domain-containing protein n=1 Tax=Wickerhamomyces pijperi TaxID=599730 RepID=A0A9P8Q8A4_WICPI|nr:hypothetical protein WICPIJ_003196 [Wickerhamomyces pijperi]